jgi:outer membrane receptor protein involved in Fe transport
MSDLLASRHPLAVAVALALATGAAGAQESRTTLEEIVVTAQKRAESLQDVPVAVSAVSGVKIAESGILKIEDLRNFVPTLWMTETAIGNNIAIRGVFSGVNPGFEQSVGTYVDGIYRGRPQQTRAPFLDLERVEVLRGPQSILFGKNSIAGALNITTARPTRDFSASASAMYVPDFNEQEVNGFVSGPVTDSFRARLTARYLETDGYLKNLTLGKDEPHRKEHNVRGWLEWDATENLTLSLKAETGSYDVVGRQIEITDELPVPGAPSATNPFGGLVYSQILAALGQDPSVLNNYPDYRRSSNGDFSNNDTDEYLLNVDWRIGEHTLTAITGYSKYSFDELCDCDFTGGNVFSVTMGEKFDQTSQEIRLASPTGQTVDYIVGAYYEKADLEFVDTIQLPGNSVLVPLLNGNPAFNGTPLQGIAGTMIANTGTPRLFRQDSKAWAAFVQMTWNVSDAFRTTLGLRYTNEKKDASRSLAFTAIDGTPLTGLPAVLAPAVYSAAFNVRAHDLSGSRSEDKLLPSVILEYDWSDGIMTYLSWSQGSKSGGFDARSNNPTAPPATECATPPVPGQPRNPAGCLFGREIGSFEFQDEKADNIELGAKMAFAGNFELNGALYFTKYKDMQVSTFDGSLGFNVRNAGEAEIKGVELDARWQATGHSLFSAAVAWTDFKYKDYIGQCSFGQTPDAPDGINCNYKGKTNEFVADFVGTLAYDYRRPLSDSLEFRFGADVYYSTGTFVNPTLDPRQKQDAYAKWNARVGVGGEHWEVAVLGRNLTDEHVYPYGNDTPLAGSVLRAWSSWRFADPPRSVALQGTVRF